MCHCRRIHSGSLPPARPVSWNHLRGGGRGGGSTQSVAGCRGGPGRPVQSPAPHPGSRPNCGKEGKGRRHAPGRGRKPPSPKAAPAVLVVVPGRRLLLKPLLALQHAAKLLHPLLPAHRPQLILRHSQGAGRGVGRPGRQHRAPAAAARPTAAARCSAHLRGLGQLELGTCVRHLAGRRSVYFRALAHRAALCGGVGRLRAVLLVLEQLRVSIQAMEGAKASLASTKVGRQVGVSAPAGSEAFQMGRSGLPEAAEYARSCMQPLLRCTCPMQSAQEAQECRERSIRLPD